MNRRRSLAIILATTLITGLVALLLWRSEPRYGGRSLTDWAIDAHDYDQLGLNDRPGYLSASNAIHRMGPAAAKTAMDWLESDARWEASKLRPWVEKYGFENLRSGFSERSHSIPMILRLVGDQGRQHIEHRLSAFLSAGIKFIPTNKLDIIIAKDWPRIEPFLDLVFRRDSVRARGERVDTESLWIGLSRDNNVQSRGYIEELLLQRGSDTNRLAEAIGNDFLSSSGRRGDRYDAIRMAFSLLKLGPTGKAYLTAGLTNNAKDVVEASTRALNIGD